MASAQWMRITVNCATQNLLHIINVQLIDNVIITAISFSNFRCRSFCLIKRLRSQHSLFFRTRWQRARVLLFSPIFTIGYFLSFRVRLLRRLDVVVDFVLLSRCHWHRLHKFTRCWQHYDTLAKRTQLTTMATTK